MRILPSHLPYPSFKKEKRKNPEDRKLHFWRRGRGQRGGGGEGINLATKMQILTSSNLESTVLATKASMSKNSSNGKKLFKKIHK
jgi:hypothetical protein